MATLDDNDVVGGDLNRGICKSTIKDRTLAPVLLPNGEDADFAILNNTIDDGRIGVRAYKDAGERLALINNSFTNLETDIIRGDLDPVLLGNNSYGNASEPYHHIQTKHNKICNVPT